MLQAICDGLASAAASLCDALRSATASLCDGLAAASRNLAVSHAPAPLLNDVAIPALAGPEKRKKKGPQNSSPK